MIEPIRNATTARIATMPKTILPKLNAHKAGLSEVDYEDFRVEWGWGMSTYTQAIKRCR